MKATISQAQKNEKNLSIEFRSYGHWKISMDYRGKRISATTTDSQSVDNFKSDWDEKDYDGRNRRKSGYVSLCEEIIRNNA